MTQTQREFVEQLHACVPGDVIVLDSGSRLIIRRQTPSDPRFIEVANSPGGPSEKRSKRKLSRVMQKVVRLQKTSPQ